MVKNVCRSIGKLSRSTRVFDSMLLGGGGIVIFVSYLGGLRFFFVPAARSIFVFYQAARQCAILRHELAIQ